MTRPASSRDLAAIAAAHRAAFPDFYLTQLGTPFLVAYYRAVLAYPRGVLLVSEGAGGVEGFVAGFFAPSAFYAFLQRRQVRLALAMLPALVTHPRLVTRALMNRRRVAAAAEEQGGVATTVELSSIGVRPGAAGRGTGRVLLEAFRSAAAAGGASSVILTTDADGNDAVNRFYEQAGFRLARAFEAVPGRMMNEFVWIPDQRGKGAADDDAT